MKRARHIKLSEKQFKRWKRADFKNTRKALSELKTGCAYLPNHAHLKLKNGMQLIEEAYELCKPWWKNA